MRVVRTSLGPFELKITFKPRKDILEEREGVFSRAGGIEIADDLKGAELVSCLLHEFTHAVFYYYGIDELLGDEKEELITFALGNGLTQLLAPLLSIKDVHGTVLPTLEASVTAPSE